MPIGDPVSAVANGNIRVYVAVKFDATASFRVIEASAGDAAVGISQKGERRDPSNSDGFCAVAEETLYYWGNGAKQVPARIGVGGCTAGDRLKVGTNGRLIPVSANNDKIVAIAQQTAIEDDLAVVDVALGVHGA